MCLDLSHTTKINGGMTFILIDMHVIILLRHLSVLLIQSQSV